MIRYIQFLLHPTQLVEGRYRYILTTQLLLAIAYPLVDQFSSLRFLLDLILFLAFVTAILVTIKNRFWFSVSILFSSLFLTTHWLEYFVDWPFLDSLSIIFGMIFLGVITAALLHNIFSVREEVTADLIFGVISVYLLMGSMFAMAHLLIEVLQPGSFSGLNFPEASMNNDYPSFVYYSFVTLTTLGYGDITPLSRIAGTLAYSEAIMGQMYLSILVARLVGMHISYVKMHKEVE